MARMACVTRSRPNERTLERTNEPTNQRTTARRFAAKRPCSNGRRRSSRPPAHDLRYREGAAADARFKQPAAVAVASDGAWRDARASAMLHRRRRAIAPSGPPSVP
jgi:hypothetical protein